MLFIIELLWNLLVWLFWTNLLSGFLDWLVDFFSFKTGGETRKERRARLKAAKLTKP